MFDFKSKIVYVNYAPKKHMNKQKQFLLKTKYFPE